MTLDELKEKIENPIKPKKIKREKSDKDYFTGDLIQVESDSFGINDDFSVRYGCPCIPEDY